MSEKKYFKHLNQHINAAYAFPEKIRAFKGVSFCEISTINSTVELLQADEDYAEITESEFLQVFHEVQNEITLRYHNQFSTENQFIKNESLKSEGY